MSWGWNTIRLLATAPEQWAGREAGEHREGSATQVQLRNTSPMIGTYTCPGCSWATVSARSTHWGGVPL